MVVQTCTYVMNYPMTDELSVAVVHTTQKVFPLGPLMVSLGWTEENDMGVPGPKAQSTPLCRLDRTGSFDRFSSSSRPDPPPASAPPSPKRERSPPRATPPPNKFVMEEGQKIRFPPSNT